MNYQKKSVCKVERTVPSALPGALRTELGTTRSTFFVLRSCFPYSLFLFSFLLFSCEREQRTLGVEPPSAEQASLPQVGDLAPGPQHNKAPSAPNPDENNSWARSEGKRSYEAYNCVSGHAHGRGRMGPPFRDEKWIYGYD